MNLDYFNPVIWFIWLLQKVLRFSQKVPSKVYYAIAIIIMMACIVAGIYGMFT